MASIYFWRLPRGHAITGFSYFAAMETSVCTMSSVELLAPQKEAAAIAFNKFSVREEGREKDRIVVVVCGEQKCRRLCTNKLCPSRLSPSSSPPPNLTRTTTTTSGGLLRGDVLPLPTKPSLQWEPFSFPGGGGIRNRGAFVKRSLAIPTPSVPPFPLPRLEFKGKGGRRTNGGFLTSWRNSF